MLSYLEIVAMSAVDSNVTPPITISLAVGINMQHRHRDW
jgi:hypothetical protein